MTKEEMLKKIAELEQQLDKTKQELANEQAKNYDLNTKLDEALLKISTLQEKYGIERIKQILPKNEKLNVIINEVEEIKKEEIKTKRTNKGKKYKKSFDYEKHVVETRYIEPDDKICPNCGSELIVASENIRYVVEVIPSKIKVIKLIKQNKKCSKCNKNDNKLYYPLVDDIFNGSILTPSFASYILYNKYELGIPFHHLSHHLSQSLGFEITKQNLANYMIKVSELLTPIYEKMKSDLINDTVKVMHCDETTLVVSKKDETNNDRKKSYVYLYTSSFYSANQIRIYEFHETRSIDITSKWLENYEGTIHCDDFKGYDKLKHTNANIKLQRCWAHVRRRYSDIVKTLPQNKKSNSVAYKILLEISKMFDLEKKYRSNKLNPIEILQNRKNEMPNIIKNLEKLIFDTEVVKGSALDKANNYTKTCWPDLFTFMDIGLVELSNNAAERAIKPFVVQRKVFQTSGSYAGARYTTKLFSIVQTCKINNVNIEKYIEYVLNNINKLNTDDLLPYSKNIRKNVN